MENLEITNLSVSKEFAEMCKENNFESLEDILEYPLTDLLKKPQFKYRMMMELLMLLESKKMESKLKLI